MFGSVDDIRARQVAEIRKRVSDRGHLPVQNANDSRLGLVEDHVIDFVVAMHQGALIAGLRWLVGEEAHHVYEVRQFADWLFGIHVFGLGLRAGNCGERLDLPVVESGRFAKGFQADFFGDDAVEFG